MTRYFDCWDLVPLLFEEPEELKSRVQTSIGSLRSVSSRHRAGAGGHLRIPIRKEVANPDQGRVSLLAKGESHCGQQQLS